MKKIFIFLAAMFIATAAVAQSSTNTLTAEENFQKGGDAWKVENYKEAAIYLEKASKQGNVKAQYILGILYKNGQGVEQSMQKCVEWWEKSASQGFVTAQTRLGLCYSNGDGVAKDYKKAAYWWQKAADQGDADAQCLLGACYLEGEGVPKDLKKAKELLHKAADQGQENAIKVLKDLGM